MSRGISWSKIRLPFASAAMAALLFGSACADDTTEIATEQPRIVEEEAVAGEQVLVYEPVADAVELTIGATDSPAVETAIEPAPTVAAAPGASPAPVSVSAAAIQLPVVNEVFDLAVWGQQFNRLEYGDWGGAENYFVVRPDRVVVMQVGDSIKLSAFDSTGKMVWSIDEQQSAVNTPHRRVAASTGTQPGGSHTFFLAGEDYVGWFYDDTPEPVGLDIPESVTMVTIVSIADGTIAGLNIEDGSVMWTTTDVPSGDLHVGRGGCSDRDSFIVQAAQGNYGTSFMITVRDSKTGAELAAQEININNQDPYMTFLIEQGFPVGGENELGHGWYYEPAHGPLLEIHRDGQILRIVDETEKFVLLDSNENVLNYWTYSELGGTPRFDSIQFGNPGDKWAIPSENGLFFPVGTIGRGTEFGDPLIPRKTVFLPNSLLTSSTAVLDDNAGTTEAIAPTAGAAAPTTATTAAPATALGPHDVRVVASGGLNLRDWPGADSVMTVIPNGSTVTILDVPTDYGANIFVQVNYAGQIGFVAYEFLEIPDNFNWDAL